MANQILFFFFFRDIAERGISVRIEVCALMCSGGGFLGVFEINLSLYHVNVVEN